MTNRALIFIFVTLVIDSIGWGIILPVMPQLIVDITGDTLSSATIVGGWLLVVYAGMQFVCAPVLGNLSDRFGRRPVLLLSLLLFGVNYLLMGWAPTLAWLFAGRVLSGMFAATYSTANAFVADVSLPEERARNFGIMGAAFGIGFILGPAIGGLLGELGTRAPFYVAGALALANFLFGYVVLPETLTVEHRRTFDWRRANPFGTAMRLVRYPVVWGLAGVVFLYQIGHHVLPATWSFYVIEKFQWTPGEIGASLAAVGLMMAVTQGYLIGIVVPRVGERASAYLGLSFGVIAMVGYAVAQSGWMIYLFLIPGALQGLSGAAIQSIMSNQMPANAQGELQGGLGSLAGITAIIGPLAMTQTFGHFTAPNASPYLPGAAFLLAALLTLAALILFYAQVRHLSVDTHRTRGASVSE
jgi:DHA1 family tetracycline resistance protein-like MFS transporter